MNYIPLGVGGRGHHHVVQTATDTVHVVAPTGTRDRYHLDAGGIEAYMDTVREVHDWRREDYGVGLGELLVRGLQG